MTTLAKSGTYHPAVCPKCRHKWDEYFEYGCYWKKVRCPECNNVFGTGLRRRGCRHPRWQFAGGIRGGRAEWCPNCGALAYKRKGKRRVITYPKRRSV